MYIHFEKAEFKHKDILFNWLEEPHVKEFWDNSQGHRDDILNFMGGRKEPSSYCDGLFTYWVGFIDEDPYCLVMTIQEKPEYDIAELKKAHLSKYGRSYGIDFMIGNPQYFGKGLAAKTLKKFLEFIRESVDKRADTFIIDPDVSNPRARHVYENAGFEFIGDFIQDGSGVFAGCESHLLVKKFPLKIDLIEATLADYPCMQNMARFYVYDMSRYCGFISADWALPSDGLYECYDCLKYFNEASKKAYLIKHDNELAGFVLLSQDHLDPKADWFVSEFFILGKFQGKGVGRQVAKQIWDKHPGAWLVTVIPENAPALAFWINAISEYTGGHYTQEIKTVTYDQHQPKRVFFTFDSVVKNEAALFA